MALLQGPPLPRSQGWLLGLLLLLLLMLLMQLLLPPWRGWSCQLPWVVPLRLPLLLRPRYRSCVGCPICLHWRQRRCHVLSCPLGRSPLLLLLQLLPGLLWLQRLLLLLMQLFRGPPVVLKP